MSRSSVYRLLALASGTAGLMYEILWLRVFTSVFGSTTRSVSTLVGVFLVGTAFGAWLVGRFLERIRAPLRLYVALELLTAVFGLTAFHIFLGTGTEALAFAGWPELYAWTTTVLIAALCVFVPAACLGAVVPTLAAAGIDLDITTQRFVGQLYSRQNVGAAVGAITTVFLLFSVGYETAYYVAIAVTLASASIGFVNAGVPPDRSPYPAADATVPRGTRVRPRWLMVAFVLGCLGLSFEVFWFRVGNHVLRASLLSFGSLLASYLLGLGLGSLVASRSNLGPRPKRWLDAVFAALAVAFVAAGPALSVAPGSLAARLVLVVGTTLFVTFLFGAAFPMLVVLVVSKETAGREVGQLLGANAAGSFFGSIITGFVLLPSIGTWGVGLGLGMVAATMPFVVADAGRLPFVRRAVVVVVVASIGVGTQAWLPTFLKTTRPEFEGSTILEVVENSNQILTVLEDERHRTLVGGPFVSGSSHQPRRLTQRFQGHLPMLVHESPEHVLEIGYGVGEILRAVLRHRPSVVDLVEIDPDMIRVADRYFSAINGNASRASSVTTHTMDGRRFLMRTPTSVRRYRDRRNVPRQ